MKPPIERAFCHYCYEGSETKFDYLIKKYPKLDIHFKNELPFQTACEFGQLHIAKKLIALEPTHGKINIHADEDLAFERACKNKRKDVLEYLISLEETHGPIDINLHTSRALLTAVMQANKEIVKLLLNLAKKHGKRPVDDPNYELFKIAIQTGNQLLGQYLIDQYDFGQIRDAMRMYATRQTKKTKVETAIANYAKEKMCEKATILLSAKRTQDGKMKFPKPGPNPVTETQM
jgi:hypothetical protein